MRGSFASRGEGEIVLRTHAGGGKKNHREREGKRAFCRRTANVGVLGEERGGGGQPTPACTRE